MTNAAAVLAALAVLVTLAAGCTRQEPEVTLEQQVPAAARTGDAQDGEGGDTGGGGDGGGGDGEAGEGGAVLTFVAIDIDYADAPADAPAGSLEVELVNDGNLPHNVVFEDVQGDAIVAEANGGETSTGTVDLEAGDYTYYCSIAGHREAGMEGELTVE